MSNLNALFNERIREEARSAINFSSVPLKNVDLKAYNPVCGDLFDFSIIIEDGIIHNISFHGHGCILSKASSSILSKELIDKSLIDSLGLAENFISKLNKHEILHLEPYSWFSNHNHDFDQRMDCVQLSWQSFIEYLRKKL